MSKVLVNNFGKRIEVACADKKHLQQFVIAIQKYFDKNNEIIYGTSPGKRLFFTDADKEVVYAFTKIRPEEVKLAMKSIAGVNSSWKLLNDPFVILSTLIIRELTKIKKEPERNFTMMYVAMKFYSNRQYQSFPHEPNEQIMAYTINNLSDKFKYKTLKNNYNVVKDTVLTSHKTYERILLIGEDQSLVIYIPQMENRIGKLIKNIAELFYDNRENKRFLNLERSFDDENDRMLDADTSSSIIHQMAEGVTHEFISKKINVGLIRLACSRNDVSFSVMFNTLNSIKQNEKMETINALISNILTQLFNADHSILERICSTEFTVYALKQLSVSNTISPELIDIKKILERLLAEHCAKYAMTNRAATKTNYRSSLYAYFIFLIIMFRCH